MFIYDFIDFLYRTTKKNNFNIINRKVVKTKLWFSFTKLMIYFIIQYIFFSFNGSNSNFCMRTFHVKSCCAATSIGNLHQTFIFFSADVLFIRIAIERVYMHRTCRANWKWWFDCRKALIKWLNGNANPCKCHVFGLYLRKSRLLFHFNSVSFSLFGWFIAWNDRFVLGTECIINLIEGRIFDGNDDIYNETPLLSTCDPLSKRWLSIYKIAIKMHIVSLLKKTDDEEEKVCSFVSLFLSLSTKYYLCRKLVLVVVYTAV